MSALFNLARMTTATTGTGTITLGAAVSGYLSFAAAGVTDGQIVSYAIRDGANSEIGFGTYTAAGTTLTRNVTNSTNSNAAISLSGTAEVFITPRAQDFILQAMDPGGRLTLTSNTPIMTADALSQTTIYYTPYIGAYIPLYDGQTFLPYEFAQLSQTTTDTTKSPAAVVSEACYDMFVWNDAGTLRCTRGPAWALASTVTITIASPAVVTWTNHGLTEGMPVVFSNSGGALPTGITAGTVYYVARAPAASTFSISTSVANAMTNTRVNTSGTQSGTQTATARCKGRGTGAGTSELVLVKGIYLNANAITNGPAAQRGTYVGTVRSDAANTINWGSLNAAASGGGSCKFDLWNMYNRVDCYAMNTDNGVSYTYSSSTIRAHRNSVTNRIWFVLGLGADPAHAFAAGDVATSSVFAGPAYFGPSYDSTTSFIGFSFGVVNYQTGALLYGDSSCVLVPATIGAHFAAILEAADGTNNATFHNDADTNLRLSWKA